MRMADPDLPTVTDNGAHPAVFDFVEPLCRVYMYLVALKERKTD